MWIVRGRTSAPVRSQCVDCQRQNLSPCKVSMCGLSEAEPQPLEGLNVWIVRGRTSAPVRCEPSTITTIITPICTVWCSHVSTISINRLIRCCRWFTHSPTGLCLLSLSFELLFYQWMIYFFNHNSTSIWMVLGIIALPLLCVVVCFVEIA